MCYSALVTDSSTSDPFLSSVVAHDDHVEASRVLLSLLDDDRQVGDLIRMDFGTAEVLVHDALRQQVGGVPHGCLLLATRLRPGNAPDASGNPSMLLLRALKSSTLPNDIEMQQARLLAGQRASDSADNWDEGRNTDQFTLNQMRYAGVSCKILGTFSVTDGKLAFGGDIDNFYAGQGMKVYKPAGDALGLIANFALGATDQRRVPIGKLRYAAAARNLESPESVPVFMTTRDILAQRTALFGMTRTGKSNTTKTIAKAVFKMRLDPKEPLRVAQLIIDPNGEYANENPQDKGCLKNIKHLAPTVIEDVVTYGLTPHPNDPDRRIMRLNFFGETIPTSPPNKAEDLDDLLQTLYTGKQIVDRRLEEEDAGYIAAFRMADLEVNTRSISDQGQWTRYRRALFVYRAILAGAGFVPPRSKIDVTGLFGNDAVDAMKEFPEIANFTEHLGRKFFPSWDVAGDFCKALQSWTKHSSFISFNESYQQKKRGRSWTDDRILGLLSIFEGSRGLRAIQECRQWHDPDQSREYTVAILDDLEKGCLVILDQDLGDPVMNEQSAERIMRAIFNRQQQFFIRPPTGPDGMLQPPPPVLIYVEEAHTLLPKGNEQDTRNIWARTAKEGAKFNIGLVYSTQEPSSVQTNILQNTENWFIAHLNSTAETRVLDQYNDFEDFTASIRSVKEAGFLRVRMMSSPYTVPVQIDLFAASPEA